MGSYRRRLSAMEKLAVAYSDTPTANNATFQQPNPFNYREDNIRLDYRFNEKHSIYGRYLHDHYDLIDPFGTFIDSPLPTIQPIACVRDQATRSLTPAHHSNVDQ